MANIVINNLDPNEVVAVREFAYSWLCKCGHENLTKEISPREDVTCELCSRNLIVGAVVSDNGCVSR